MNEKDYDSLFRLLCKLQMEAPCHNGSCVGHMNCNYGINGCYGEGCSIDEVRSEAEILYGRLILERGGKYE